jgi:SOS-response transcriptional repressor LexA
VSNPRAPKERRQQILDYLRDCVGRDVQPTMREIGAAVGIPTASNVAYHLGRLEVDGLITAAGSGKFRRITTVDGHCMTCGQHLPGQAP